MKPKITTATEPHHDAKLPVGSSALLDWNKKFKRAQKDFAKWVNSPEHKKMIEGMKRLGAIH